MGPLSRRAFSAALVACALTSAHVIAASPTEYQVKAVFLFNFTQFVDWPETSFDSPTAPLVIGVLGDDPFGSTLQEAIAGETVNGRTLELRRYRSIEEVAGCHILFIAPPVKTPLPTLLQELHRRNVLTVSDAREFAKQGGVIEFATVGNRIRLHINLDAAKQANLTISSKLLKPARIVQTN